MRRTLTDEQQDRVAQAIVGHLALSNWKIEQGPAPDGHGPNIMPMRSRKHDEEDERRTQGLDTVRDPP
jgi:hypothetical protein